MTFDTLIASAGRALGSAFTALILTFSHPASAGPGAHGPGGEHLDAPAAQGAGAHASPRMEAKSELFELVARLDSGELSIMIDRFETNEPVLEASVEIALGALKATAQFHADHGDYAVDDAAFLKALSAPGEHPLIFTIVAGNDSDLLEGTLQVSAAQAHADAVTHSHLAEQLAIAAAVLAAVVLLVILWRRRSRRRLAYAAVGRST